VKARPSDAQDLRRSAAGASEFNAVENGSLQKCAVPFIATMTLRGAAP
jgi:hypothetical protein